MRIITFLIHYTVADRIINHLKPRFVVDRPPPPFAYRELSTADESSAEYLL